MESESFTHKVSDSGYSISCSNSQSQRSGSSKSRNSGSHSSRSSGYCGHPSTNGSSFEAAPQPISKRNKDKEHKKKKLKCSSAVSPAASEKPNETTDKTFLETVQIDLKTQCIIEHGPAVSNTATPRLAAIAEGDVIDDGTPLSPHVAKAAESAQIDDDMVPKWDGEKEVKDLTQEENHHVETMEATPEDVSAESAAKTFCQPEDGFCCVISMYDGVVLYTTSGLTSVLGFPKDMWLGRSFIEFVHQKDREIFASQITKDLAVPFIDTRGKKKDISNSLFVNLRRYRGLKSSGYGVVEKAVSYIPFHLTITFRQVNDQNDLKYGDDRHGMFLIVVAVPVRAIYKVPDESCKLSKFSTRHTAACIISHVDQDIVPNFGFFPQDMIGRCIFDFYHPADMPLLKEVYERVMEKCKLPGTMFKSKPYRFLVQNGQYATVETEWTSFVNPWTKKLEIVINHHRVVQGPSNPNVFDKPEENSIKNIPEDVWKRSKIIRDEIQLLLNQLVQLDSGKQQVSQRCKDLASFMETLMDEVSKSNLKIDLCQENNTSVSVSSEFKLHTHGITSHNKERDSVMLGGISPHHDYSDSKSSSETPLSYNQLNYNENIQRFFQSKPMTTVSDEMNGPLQSTIDTDQEGKSTSAGQDCPNQKCLSPVHGSGASGSGSGGNLSSESNPQMENATTSGTNISNDSYKPPHLTEALLSKHNEDMEKIMVKRHRQQRSLTKSERDRESKKLHSKNLLSLANADKHNQHQSGHGVKRSGSYSWEEDNHKVSKHQHQNEQKNSQHVQENSNAYTPLLQCSNLPSSSPAMKIPCSSSMYQPGVDNVNLWPPFSVAVTPIHTTQPCTAGIVNNSASGYTTGMFPTVCYIPTHTGQSPREYPGPPVSGPFHVQYMPSVMYPTLYGPSTMLYPQVTMLQPVPMPVQQQQPHPMVPTEKNVKENEPKTNQPSTNAAPPNKGLFQRPSSQATSVKAEPGSALGSIASASVANRAMSECSRKDLALQSVCSPDSVMVNPQDGETVVDTNGGGGAKIIHNISLDREANPDCSLEADEESSYSSFYSSFLKTDTGSGSNEDNNNSETKHVKEQPQDVTWQKPRTNPIRKPDPPWLDDVTVTPALIYRYQMAIKGMDDVLKSDLNSLKEISQPDMVNDQLDQLYLEMELEGLSTKLTLEDGITSSSSSGEENSCTFKPKKKKRSYGQLVMIYEEDAPLPSPQTDN